MIGSKLAKMNFAIKLIFRDAKVWKKSKSGIWEKISSVRNSKVIKLLQ